VRRGLKKMNEKIENNEIRAKTRLKKLLIFNVIDL